MSLSRKSRDILKIALANKAIATEIADAIDSGANPIVQAITNGDTTHTPSGDAVFDALALKEAVGVAAGLVAPKMDTAAFTDAAVTSKLITGFASGAGVVAATDTILAALNKVDGNVAAKQNALTMNSAITGTGGTVGQVALVGMTATGAVVVTGLEALGAGLVISHVVCGVDMITVYTMDTATQAVAALDAKTVGYVVIKLS